MLWAMGVATALRMNEIDIRVRCDTRFEITRTPSVLLTISGEAVSRNMALLRTTTIPEVVANDLKR